MSMHFLRKSPITIRSFADLSVSVSVMGESTSAASARLPVGGRGTLVCRAFVKGSNALPRHRDLIEFAWKKKDSKDLLTDDKRFQVFQDRRKSILLIRDFQSDDSDTYRCIAFMYGSNKGRKIARAFGTVQLIAISKIIIKRREIVTIIDFFRSACCKSDD